MIGWVIGIGIVVLIVVIANYSELKGQLNNKQREVNDLHKDNRELRNTVKQWEDYEKQLSAQEKNIKQQKELFYKLFVLSHHLCNIKGRRPTLLIPLTNERSLPWLILSILTCLERG